MTLTNILLFLILVTLTTYLFMPWKGKTFLKEKPLKIMKQYILQIYYLRSTIILMKKV